MRFESRSSCAEPAGAIAEDEPPRPRQRLCSQPGGDCYVVFAIEHHTGNEKDPEQLFNNAPGPGHFLRK